MAMGLTIQVEKIKTNLVIPHGLKCCALDRFIILMRDLFKLISLRSRIRAIINVLMLYFI